MKLTLFGANGATGRELTRQALDAGHHVTAVTRHPETFPLTHPDLAVVSADVSDQDAVDRAVGGSTAVLSSLGVPFSRKPITVYSTGVGNIVAAMGRQGVRRLVVVSSSAVDHADSPQAGFVFNRILQPFVAAVIGRTTYDDMRIMEALVRNSDLEWTVLRPSGLFDADGPGEFEVTDHWTGGIYTARAALAAAMLQQLDDDRFVRAIGWPNTVGAGPGLLRMIWKEGIRKPRG